MVNRSSHFLFRILVAVTAFACAASFSSLAAAAGRVQWNSTTLKERDSKSWHLELKIFMGHPPHVAHVPMKFEFQPYTYFERAMMDGDKLVERSVPLEHQQSIVETVDVGFMDPSSGKILDRTKFSFKVTRAHGFNAGEYQVTIKDIDGNRIGATTKLTFEGENEVIDRRAMVFGSEKKKKPEKKAEEGDSDAKGDSEGKGDSDDADKKDSAEAEDADDSASKAEGSDNDANSGPPPIEEKPGGCGCRVETSGATSAVSSGALLLGLGLASRLRRGGNARRRRSDARRAA